MCSQVFYVCVKNQPHSIEADTDHLFDADHNELQTPLHFTMFASSSFDVQVRKKRSFCTVQSQATVCLHPMYVDLDGRCCEIKDDVQDNS